MGMRRSRWNAFGGVAALAGLFSLFLITPSTCLAQGLSKEDKHVLETYALTIENLNKTIAAQKGIDKIVAADSSIAKSNAPPPGETLDQKVKRIDANSKIAGAIHSVGLSTRDKALTEACAMTAYLSSESIKAGMPPEQAARTFGWKPSAAQIEFAKAHHAERERWIHASMGQ